MNDNEGISHEIWAAAQLVPGEGIEDGVSRIVSILAALASPAAQAQPVAEVRDVVGAGPNDVGIRWRGGIVSPGTLLYALPPEPAAQAERTPLYDDALGRACVSGRAMGGPGCAAPKALAPDAARDALVPMMCVKPCTSEHCEQGCANPGPGDCLAVFAAAPTQVDDAAAMHEAFDLKFCPYSGTPDPWVVWQAAWSECRAALTHRPAAPESEAVASIYVSADGAREFDDWRHALPVGRNLLYTRPSEAREPLSDDTARLNWLEKSAPGQIHFDHTKGGKGGGNYVEVRVPFSSRFRSYAPDLRTVIDAAMRGIGIPARVDSEGA